MIIRGIERHKILKNKDDRDSFLARLKTLLDETRTSCYAWALLSNHAHFLFRTGDVPLATLIRRRLTGHAATFNRKYHRHGRLFQDRYKSIIPQEGAYLLELVRYIHMNPLRARMVKTLEELKTYPYCGHGRLMGEKIDGFAKTRAAAAGHAITY